jgi:ribose transport system substrate-binding protein
MDNIEYGGSSARFLNDYFKDRLDAGEKIQVLEFKGDNSTASTMRTDGFNKFKNGNIEIVQSFSTDWQRARGLEFMETFLANSRPADIEAIDAVFTHDGEITLGVYDAIQNYSGSAKLSNLKAIAGMGSDVSAFAINGELKEKYGVDHRVVFVPPSVTDYGVAVGFDVLNGKDVPKSVKIGYVDVNMDNYKDYIEHPEKLNSIEVKY